MSFETTFVKQMWRRQRRFFVDWFLIVSMAIVFLPFPVAVLSGILGTLFASGIGVAIAGYATQTQTWEYLLTRGFSRDRLLRAMFVAAGVPVLVFAISCALLDLSNAREIVRGLFVPTLDEPSGSGKLLDHAFPLGFVVVVLLQAFVSSLCVSRAEDLSGRRAFAVIVPLGVVFVLPMLLQSLVHLAQGRGVHPPEFTTELSEAIASPAVLAVVLVTVVAVYWRIAWVKMGRREVGPDLGDGKAVGGSLALAVVVVLTGLAILGFALLPQPVSPDPATRGPAVAIPASSGK